LNKTCLIAESDPFLARLLERYAEVSGFKSIRARVGQEIVKLAVDNRPMVLIIDTELPGKLRGWQAVLELEKFSDFTMVPVITCCWISRHEAHALIPFAVQHLQKPDILYADFFSALTDAGVFGEGHTPLRNQSDLLPG
jgi:DNA-binding NtrC family response regulator